MWLPGVVGGLFKGCRGNCGSRKNPQQGVWRDRGQGWPVGADGRGCSLAEGYWWETLDRFGVRQFSGCFDTTADRCDMGEP